MILRNPLKCEDGRAPENVFEAIDPRTATVHGICTVNEDPQPMLFPERPYQIRLDIDSELEALDMLLGAALARASTLCAQQAQPARIYTYCSPDDEELLAQLQQYGFRDIDGVARMHVKLPFDMEHIAPAGCVLVEDMLEDPREQQYFLERYNGLSGTVRDMKWLAELRKSEGFRRMLAVGSAGMVGEIVVWKDGLVGVVEFLTTSRRWRNHGVAKYMLHLAYGYLERLGVEHVYADVRLDAPHAVQALKSAGFRNYEILRRYPCIDL